MVKRLEGFLMRIGMQRHGRRKTIDASPKPDQVADTQMYADEATQHAVQAAQEKQLRKSHGRKFPTQYQTKAEATVRLLLLRKPCTILPENLCTPKRTTSKQLDGSKLNSHSASPSSQGIGKRPKLDMIEDDLTSAANTKPPCFFAEAPSLNVLANASDLDIRIWAWDHELARWDFYCFCLTTGKLSNRRTQSQRCYFECATYTCGAVQLAQSFCEDW